MVNKDLLLIGALLEVCKAQIAIRGILLGILPVESTAPEQSEMMQASSDAIDAALEKIGEAINAP